MRKDTKTLIYEYPSYFKIQNFGQMKNIIINLLYSTAERQKAEVCQSLSLTGVC